MGVGIDLFIGNSDHLGRGLGEKVISQFIQEEVFTDTNTICCIVDPLATNTRMIHVNEKMGFKLFKITDEKEPRYLMILNR